MKPNAIWRIALDAVRWSGSIPNMSGVKPDLRHEVRKTWFGWPLVWSLIAAATTLSAHAASELQTFARESFSAIRQSNTGRPLVVAFWSTHCEPCKAELTLLAQLHRDFPTVKIVLVATDIPAERPAVLRFLAKYELGKIGLWQFGDEAEERIRYSVDPSWHGELPRSYFFDQRDGITKRSGVPDEAWVRRWFEEAATNRSAREPRSGSMSDT